MKQDSYKIDPWLFGATAVLLSISLLMVYSTTALLAKEEYGSSSAMILRHLFHISLGLFALYIFSRIDLSRLDKLAIPLLVFAIFTLFLVLIPGIGYVAGGARRWIVAGPLRLQPGEVAKVILIIYFASYIGRHKEQMFGFVCGIVKPLAIVSLTALLLLLEPDFGSTVIVLFVVFGQLLTSARLRHLTLVSLAGAMALTALIASSPYRMKRFRAFLNPFEDPSDTGYQLIQSLIAVGSGGVTGGGLGAGQQKLYYLPAAHTDFIFAMIAEELGLIGALFVLGLFLIICIRGLIHAKRLAENPYLSSLAVGCTLLIVVPALLNMAVVLGLLPTKGLVLPLVAYGGTAMVANLSVIGLLLGLSRIGSSASVRL